MNREIWKTLVIIGLAGVVGLIGAKLRYEYIIEHAPVGGSGEVIEKPSVPGLSSDLNELYELYLAEESYETPTTAHLVVDKNNRVEVDFTMLDSKFAADATGIIEGMGGEVVSCIEGYTMIYARVPIEKLIEANEIAGLSQLRAHQPPQLY